MKSKKLAILMLPFLAALVLQATQYARAPVGYNYYVVYAKNADIALRPGADLSPNGQTLLQNSSEPGLYEISLGRWGPGYRVNYTDAFHVVNREVFNIKMIGANFSSSSTGLAWIKIYVQNDTDDDGVGDTEVECWNGTHALISPTSYIYLKAAAIYGNDGGDSQIKIQIRIPEDLPTDLSDIAPEQTYSGNMHLYFTNG